MARRLIDVSPARVSLSLFLLLRQFTNSVARLRRSREASKAKAAKNFKAPIVTEIVLLKAFYPAEDYHQNYYNSNKNQGYCQFVITPKLKKLIQEGVIPQGKE